MISRTFSLEKTVEGDSISRSDEISLLRFSPPSLRSDEDIEEALKEQERRIRFWARAKIARNAVVFKEGGYGLATEITAIGARDKEENLRYVFRGRLRKGLPVGFPCSYLRLPLQVIDCMVRFPSALYKKREDTRGGIGDIRYVVEVLRLVQILHKNGITGMSFEEGYVHCNNVQYDGRGVLQRKDVKLFARQMEVAYPDAALQDCYRDASTGKSAKYLLNTHFTEFPVRSFPTAKAKRQVLPSTILLENILVEAKKYPHDEVRFYFLAFDWAYRVSEALDYPSLAYDLVQMARILLRLSSEDSNQEKYQDIILVLDGILLLEPVYGECFGSNSMLSGCHYNILRKAIPNPSEYLDVLTLGNLPVSAARIDISVVHMQDLE